MASPAPRILSFCTLGPFLLAWAAACSGTVVGGGDSDDEDDVGVDGGGGTDGLVEPDAPAPCVPTGNEVYGDGLDNDCDGIVDELRVCGDGSEPFATIAAAVAAAPDGGGVEVCAGTYAERLVITRSIVAPGSMDFHLASGSACINASDPGMADRDGSRADLGNYGGPDAP